MFQDKVVIVTGAASGIGREMCLYLAREKNQRDKSKYPTAKDCIHSMMQGIKITKPLSYHRQNIKFSGGYTGCIHRWLRTAGAGL